MSSIDNRIVNMVFNNKGFEAGVASTLASLKKLNESLKMKTTGKGLEEVGRSVDKLNTSGMGALGSAVEGVTSKFSAMAVIAASALNNLTNKAINAGTAFAKSLTIEPITTGLNEYETKMNSIQTILTNTSHNGTTLDQVNTALAELNTYADKTIYNFAQMTDNIGKFTAAGVDLDTSVASIKGIANLAAASGSSSAQASTAMYQLSQALAAGKVSLMDWNSVVNAGMGGKLFQDALIRTSEHLGTGAESMIKKFGSFRESLTKGEWLTTDVLTETLKQISGAYTEADLIAQGYTKSQAKAITELAKNATAAATEVKTVTQLFDTMKESVQSGWAQTWEYIIGDKDQATKMLTSVNNAFEKMIKPATEARNKMFEEWNKGGGRDSAIQAFSNVFGSIGKVAGSVKDAFRDIFPAMTGKKLIELTKGFEKFTEKLKVSDKTAAKIKDTFKGLFSVFDFLKDGVSSIFKAFTPSVGIFGGLTDGLLTITSSIGKFFSSVNEGVKSSGVFDKISSSISNAINGIGDGFNKAGEFVGNLIKSVGKIDFKPLFDFIGQIGGGFGKGISDIFTGIGKAIGNLNLNTVLGGLTALATKGVFDKLGGMFDNISGSIKNFTGIGANVKEVLSSVTDTLRAMATDINAGALLKVAGAVGILSISLSALSTIDQGSLNTALTGLTAIFIELVAAMGVIMKLSSSGSKGGLLGNFLGGFIGKGSIVGIASGLLVFSSAVLVLAGAIKVLSSLNPEQMMAGLAGIAGSMLVLVGAAKLLDGIKGRLIKAGAAMILMAAALNVIASAVQKFSQINPNNMLVGLMAVATTLLELSAFMKITDFSGMGVTSAAGILILAGALLVLQNAVAKFGSMKVESLIQGLLGVAGALGVIAGFSHLSGSAAGMLVTAAALVVMGGALHVLSSAVRSMAGLQWDDMARGLVTMAGSLTILAVAVRLMSGLGLAAVGAGLIIASGGLILMATALKSLGEMSWDEMARGLVALAGGLVVLGVAAAAMSGMIVGAGALLVLSAAMAILTPQLVAMANLSWGEIGAGLAMLAGSLTILGIAGLAATAIGPGLIMLGTAVALLGVGCIAAGAGVAVFSAGLATLATVGAAGGFALVEILKQLISLLPQLGTKLGECLVNMAAAIGNGIPTLVNAFGQMLEGFVQAFVTYGPRIVELGAQLIELLCGALIQAGPRLIQVAVDLVLMLAEGLAGAADQLASAGADLVIGLLNGLASKLGDVIQAGIELAISLLDGIADGIGNNAERIGTSLGNALSAAVKGVGAVIKGLLKGLGGDAVDGFADGIEGGGGDVKSSVKKVISDGQNEAKQSKSKFKTAGSDMIKGLAEGIKAGSGDVKSAIEKLVNDAVNKAKSSSSKFNSAGKEWSSKLASGIKSGSSGVSSAVKSVVSSAVSAARSGSGQMRSAGASMMEGFTSGIKSKAASAAAAAASAVASAISAAKAKLQINSPSKVFIGIGRYTMMGLEKGIDDNAYRGVDATENMVNSMMSTMQASIARVSDAVNMNVDAQPVIRPVMDLTNVERGSQTIGQMLANNNIGINAETSSTISRSLGGIQNRNTNGELISAIKDLQGNMNNSGNTYQINGITYDDGSNVRDAIETLIRATNIERRI